MVAILGFSHAASLCHTSHPAYLSSRVKLHGDGFSSGICSQYRFSRVLSSFLSKAFLKPWYSLSLKGSRESSLTYYSRGAHHYVFLFYSQGLRRKRAHILRQLFLRREHMYWRCRCCILQPALFRRLYSFSSPQEARPSPCWRCIRPRRRTDSPPAMRARSLLSLFFIPQDIPAAVKPFGSAYASLRCFYFKARIPLCVHCSLLNQPFLFIYTEHYVHILYRRSRGSLSKVVIGGGKYNIFPHFPLRIFQVCWFQPAFPPL